MRLSVLSHQAGPVHAKDHVKVLYGHIVQQHVIATLQKGRIDRKHRQRPLLRHAGRHGHRVLLCDPHIKKAIGVLRRKMIQPGTGLHGRGDHSQIFILSGQVAHGLAKDRGKRTAARRQGRAVFLPEGANAVEPVRLPLRRWIAFSLYSLYMEQNRAVEFLCIEQQLGQLRHIVPVHRPHAGKAHILKHGIGQHRILDHLFDPMGEPVDSFAHRAVARQAAVRLLHPEILGLQPLPGQVAGHAAHILGDGHAVVIEDHNHGFSALPGIGQALKRQTAGHGAVADHGQHMIVLMVQRPGPGHAQSHRHRIGGMAGNKGVRPVLLGLREAGQSAELPQRHHLPAPASQDLVGIALVSHVKDQPVHIQVKHPVDGHCQFHYPETGGQMTTGVGNAFNDCFSQTVAKLFCLQIRQLIHMFRYHAVLPAFGLLSSVQNAIRLPTSPTAMPSMAPIATCSGVWPISSFSSSANRSGFTSFQFCMI